MADSENYIKARERYIAALREALAIANDPFKAPEILVFDAKDVLAAIWDVQIEFSIMERAGKREREKKQDDLSNRNE